MATGVLIAIVSEFTLGFISKIGDLFRGEQPPISYSVEEIGAECGSKTFLPDRRAKHALRAGIDGPFHWEAFHQQQGAAYAEYDAIQVAIEGESAREVVLTDIEFKVERRSRPPGAVFSMPCGGPIVGRGMEVDVEERPVRLLLSSAGPDGELGPGFPVSGDIRPISFPWTVSLGDPLLLYIVATARSCFCVWKAEIPWVSGDKRGTIEVDDSGEGFAVVGVDGITSYTVSAGGWKTY